MYVEEFGLHAVERAGENIFQPEISILLADNVTMIIRDNGEHYDIIKTAQEGKFTFTEFIIEGITSNLSQRAYAFSGDENQKLIIPVRIEKISDEELELRKKELEKPFPIVNEPLYRIYLFETPTAKYF